jgi:hypothetical protein
MIADVGTLSWPFVASASLAVIASFGFALAARAPR